MTIPAIPSSFSPQQVLGPKIEEIDLRPSFDALWMASIDMTVYFWIITLLAFLPTVLPVNDFSSPANGPCFVGDDPDGIIWYPFAGL